MQFSNNLYLLCVEYLKIVGQLSDVVDSCRQLLKIYLLILQFEL